MLHSLTNNERVIKFGHLPFKLHPSKDGRVIVPMDWKLHNLKDVMIPQLAKLPPATRVLHSVTFHYKTAPRVVQLWAEWEKQGFLQDVKTWNGSFVCRMKRGKEGSNLEQDLSNHSWGTAFDINAALWPRGKYCPSASGAEMARIAEHFGFAWGEHFSTPDPMHFEQVEE